MPDVAGGVQAGEALADVSGPNASLEYGEAGPVQQMANSLKNNAPGAYAAAQPPQPGGPQGGGVPDAAPGGQAGPPIQPPPHDIMTPDKVNNQVFTPPQQVSYPYAQGWQVAAAHPRAGPYTQLMARLTKQGAKPNGPATPGQ